MLSFFVSITFISALAGHIATSIPTWKCAVRLFAARAIEAVSVNEPQVAVDVPMSSLPGLVEDYLNSFKFTRQNGVSGQNHCISSKKKALTIGRPSRCCVGVCS
jgi:hypothetical protein